MDHLSPEDRSKLMSRIRGKSTSPELVVRKVARSLGFRCRLNVRALPGCPDLAYPPLKKAVFVHGCFWHRHTCRKGRSMPATRKAFWTRKLEGNKARDARNRRDLTRLGWKVLTVWECQTSPSHLSKLKLRLAGFLAK
jgi:DNA mismatch endonuclease, patch repair protein